MNEAPKFEEGLEALEKLVAELEGGDLGLDDALKRFEKGVKLAAQMQKSLEDTGRRIEQLGAAPSGTPRSLEDTGKSPSSPRARAPKGAGPAPTLF